MYDASPESYDAGAVPGVGFQLIASLLCLLSLFEVDTPCLALLVKTMRVSCRFTYARCIFIFLIFHCFKIDVHRYVLTRASPGISLVCNKPVLSRAKYKTL